MSTFDPFGQPPAAGPLFPPAGSTELPAPDMGGKARRGRKGKAKGPGDPDGRKPGRRTISANRRGALIMAAVAGVVGLLLITDVAGGSKTYVVVAKQGISPLATVSDSQLDVVQVAPKNVIADAFTGSSKSAALDSAKKAIKGLDTLYPLAQGQQLTKDWFSQPAQLVPDLAPDDRLVSVTASVATAVGGTLRAGDHVTVYATLENATGASGALSGVLVPDAQIVSIQPGLDQFNSAAQQQASTDGQNKQPSQLLPSQPIPGIYVLKVKTDQVQPLISVDGTSGARLYMVYHGANSPQASQSAPLDALTALCAQGGAGAANLPACQTGAVKAGH